MSDTKPGSPTDAALPEPLWRAIEEVDNSWHDEGDHVEWDEERLPDALIALRRAYWADVERVRAASGSPTDAALRAEFIKHHNRVCGCPFDGTDPDCNMQGGVLIGTVLATSGSPIDAALRESGYRFDALLDEMVAAGWSGEFDARERSALEKLGWVRAASGSPEPVLDPLRTERMAVVAAARLFLTAHDHIVASPGGKVTRDDSFAMKNASDVLRIVLREYDSAAALTALPSDRPGSEETRD